MPLGRIIRFASDQAFRIKVKIGVKIGVKNRPIPATNRNVFFIKCLRESTGFDFVLSCGIIFISNNRCYSTIVLPRPLLIQVFDQ